ncbi:heavy metal translocating P-type ATPase [Tautonia sociabilis]|uniref:Cadmium-translocating P-type ATPase n=1 Tax=Tautonia sociabilis TaxID=2080755 RepID=A0A432MQ50_9BACT|nr:heavy metal translocating P-type ATPase [Tautonia sociabilis]RUL89480.1 cadmium-translocating P-type ATPase [Tautonia sociabilis]
MDSRHTLIDLNSLLPELPGADDACVARLEALIGEGRGISRAHTLRDDGGPATLCLHYDPDVVTLAQVERLARAAGLQITERFGHALLPFRLVGGEDAARRVEAGLARLHGVLGVSVSLPAQAARVEFDRRGVSLEEIERRLRELTDPPSRDRSCASCGPAAGGREGTPDGWYARHKELIWSLVAIALLAAAWCGERWGGLSRGAAIAVYLGSYAFGGFDLVRHALKSWSKGRFTFDIDLLMIVASIGAAVLGQWTEGAFLLCLFSLAHALEHYALDRARGAIRALADLAPPVARVLREGREVEVAVEQVAKGEVVIVRPAERIPVDGTIRTGRSAVDQAPITGESVPVEKEPGAEVYAGTINGEGALEVETTRAVGDRTLDRVVQLVSEAQTQKAPTQQFTDRFEAIFVPAVLAADLLLITLPPLLGVWGWQTSFYRGMALLVAASPCALALGTPAAVLAAIAQAARKGVLIKGGAHLENLGTLRAIALDKTGTLTVGKPEVTDLVPAAGIDEDQLLGVAGAVERRSQHPLARAVVRRAEEAQLEFREAGELESVTARGVRSTIAGQEVEIGTLRLWEGEDIPGEIRAAMARLQAAGRSVMAVRHGDRWLGVIGVADRPREGVKEVLGRLRDLGVRPLVMLTGDNRGVGETIGREVGVDEVKADLLPEDKVSAIKEMLAAHGRVAMVGDGVNDAPALANATVGIAMGGAGTAVALETADMALMGDDLAKLPFAVGLSRMASRVIRQNLCVSLGVIALLIVATTTGYFGIGAAVFFHEGSTLVVLANALRLLGYSRGPAGDAGPGQFTQG